jgi:urease accessory protein
MRHVSSRTIAVILSLLVTGPALAHPGHPGHEALTAGLMHPLTGVDHVTAMVAVGVWAALIGGRAIWAVPAAFVVSMIGGFALVMSGAVLPFVEPAVLASVVVLGLAAALALSVPVPAAALLVGVFAIFHGFAHGSELGDAGALPFAVGFVCATAALHLAGIAMTQMALEAAGPSRGRMVVRVAALAGTAATAAIVLS